MSSLLVVAAAAACASAPVQPPPGRSALAGRVTLVAPEAMRSGGGGNAYGDRRLRGVERMDYSRPGFAVVYVEVEPGTSAPPAAERHTLTLSDGVAHPLFDPAELALGRGATLVVRNASRSAHVLSIPDLELVARLAPGEELARVVEHEGDHAVHLLDDASVSARVFAAPGPYARVGSTGGFALTDLPPGRHAVHVFHPRLPPATREVVLAPDSTLEIELSLGVAQPGED